MGDWVEGPWDGYADLGHCIHFSFWDCDWQLPECLHLADSRGAVDCYAGFALPAVPCADQVVRQCAGVWVDVAAREVPELRGGDIGHVSAGGAGHRAAVCGVLSGIWANAGDGEVDFLHVFADRIVHYRLTRADTPRPGELAGFCCRPVFLRYRTSL